jgi:hypothetical protein
MLKKKTCLTPYWLGLDVIQKKLLKRGSEKGAAHIDYASFGM